MPKNLRFQFLTKDNIVDYQHIIEEVIGPAISALSCYDGNWDCKKEINGKPVEKDRAYFVPDTDYEIIVRPIKQKNMAYIAADKNGEIHVMERKPCRHSNRPMLSFWTYHLSNKMRFFYKVSNLYCRLKVGRVLTWADEPVEIKVYGLKRFALTKGMKMIIIGYILLVVGISTMGFLLVKKLVPGWFGIFNFLFIFLGTSLVIIGANKKN